MSKSAPPLPWHTERDREWIKIVAADGVEVQAVDIQDWPAGRDVTELVVGAVNAHGPLVEALNAIEREAQGYLDYLRRRSQTNSVVAGIVAIAVRALEEAGAK